MRILIMFNVRADPQVGLRFELFGLIEAHYLFSDAGIEVVIAAPGGGSVSELRRTESLDNAAAVQVLRRYNADRRARDVMNDLVDLANVWAEDFDAALYLGPPALDCGAGVKDRASMVVNQLLRAAKPVAVIGEPPVYASTAAGNGLLLIGQSGEAIRLAANALLGAINGR